MLINEVETKVGLSKKSIRYYEAHGLLKPKRNIENSYRIYDEDDIRKLKVIKFLRELNVSIKDLEKLNSGTLSLSECMKDRIKKIEEEENNYDKVKNICREIGNKKENFSDIEINNYLKEINILNKEGFNMKKDEFNHRAKIMGAVISSLVFGTFFLFFALLMLIIFIYETDMPLILFVFLEGVFLIPLIGIVSNLITRIKEIKSGEADRASIY